MCFGCSKEPSHRDGSFEYPQYMFWLGNKKISFQLHKLFWGPERLLEMYFNQNIKSFTKTLTNIVTIIYNDAI